jgi:hypothetical protein
MKYLKSFYFMVESINTYSISNIEDDTFITKYYFTDDEDNKYLVQFKNDKIGTKSKPMVGSSYELCYYVWDREIEDWNVNNLAPTQECCSKATHFLGQYLCKKCIETQPVIEED